MHAQQQIRVAVLTALMTGLAACGGGSSGSTSSGGGAQQVSVPLMISDATSDDWATIGVKILSIALVPQSGGHVTVYTAPADAPVTNLVQLDNLADVIGDPMVPAGTYTGAVITIAANPGDVSLVTSSDPESGFDGTASTEIPSDQIKVQHTSGSTGNLTTAIDVTFNNAVTVSSGQTTPIDLEFDLNHPAFLVEHTPPALGGSVLWAVNFKGPVHHHPVADIRHLVLRHLYGSVTGISSDNTTLTITKDLPTWPAVTPETATSTDVSLNILADATDGTLFYDMDTGTESTVTDFSSVAAVLAAGEYVRVASRYQADGKLVAVRIWASSSFNKVWLSPEGHVRHINAANNQISVDNEDGLPVLVDINNATQFFFRTPQDAQADATPIGTGTDFIASGNFVRGFKVHVTAVDPLAVPLVAQSIDIENARYSGQISNAGASSFDYTHNFVGTADDYSVTLPYIASDVAQNPNATGYTGTGFQWWNFAYPKLADTGANAIGDFVSATTGAAVSFGTKAIDAWGVTGALWNSSASGSGWTAPWVILEPVRLPLGSVSTSLTYGSGSTGTFAMVPVINTSATPLNVDVSTATDQATLAYQVDRSMGTVTVSQEDLTTPDGQTAVQQGLANGAAVRVYGVPEASGNLKAYVLFYFTGMASSD
ncbi:MAG TPA: DUF4382 domain-containing protein [Steroidobacteraceae bacterium]|nr:DUF4382 domain-containing protein [Steroidobacteraceae bacterium]